MNDTITAIATAAGEAGIGIVRISGPEAEPILRKVFRYRSGNRLRELIPRRMIYGMIVLPDDMEQIPGSGVINTTCSGKEMILKERVIDEAMVVYMPAPHTYTGEDVAEIQCHGSTIALRRILSLIMDCGASLAERGEFTKRAFLNGRIDLSQAEAVIDVIQARSDAGSEAAAAQLSGRLSERIGGIRRDMADLISEIAVRIEYPEEDLEEMAYRTIIESLDGIINNVKNLADTARTGKVLKDGMRISIVGRPNVGKSSLMNALLRQDRAIVTNIPGTTRDTIEEYADLGGIPVRLTDTAGIRDSEDMIERIGIERSREAIETADLVVFMIDRSRMLTEEDRAVFPLLEGRRCILVLNKSDREAVVDREEILASSGLPEDTPVIVMSAVNREGVQELIEEIRRFVYGGEIRMEQDIMIADARHEQLLKEAERSLKDARFMLENGEALDFAESDIRTAWMLLGEITGESVTDDIVNEIFSRFCLGK